MADPANVWDLPINFFLALEVYVLLQNLQKALRANNRSSLAKDETSGPFVATCSPVRKNDENNNNNNNKKKNLKMVLVLRSHTFSSKIAKFFKEIGLRRVLTTSSYS